MSRKQTVIVVGAGVGGLTAGAVLAHRGMDVTVLESHVYPGGCAGTFFHQGYRFDAGATLAAGFTPNGLMARVAEATGVRTWPVQPAPAAMSVHFPDGAIFTRWGDDRRWPERRALFGEASGPFWEWQERTADLLWSLLRVGFPWPPQSRHELGRILSAFWNSLRADSTAASKVEWLLDAARPLTAHWGSLPRRLQLFLDAQLLISAQTTAGRANALYAAAALDLPRRGVAHVRGGIGAIAETLASALQEHGGRIFYRQRVTRVEPLSSGRYHIFTDRDLRLEADQVVFNLPPGNVARLLGQAAPRRIAGSHAVPEDGWGAVTAYVGVPDSIVPEQHILHHQVILQEPLGEGNSVFLSISPVWDHDRAPAGERAITLSTHTKIPPWWNLLHQDPRSYVSQKELYLDRLLRTAEQALPGLRQHARRALTGTPISFQRFTGRLDGWVGGYPQTHLLRTLGPRLDRSMWLVGDSIFPGQSITAVALGGLRVAKAVQGNAGVMETFEEDLVHERPRYTQGTSFHAPLREADRVLSPDRPCQGISTKSRLDIGHRKDSDRPHVTSAASHPPSLHLVDPIAESNS